MPVNNLRNDFPTYFNQVVAPPAVAWSIKNNIVEEVNQSEAGTDIVQLIRPEKITISARYKSRLANAQKLKQFSLLPSFVVKYFDTLTGSYVEKTVRMRNFSQTLVHKSEDLEGTYGIWETSCDLVEF